MTDIELRLPYPPSVNHYYGKKAVRKRENPTQLTVINFLSRRGKDYRYTVAEHVWEQLHRPPKLRDRLAMIIRMYPGPGQKQDIDNGLKSLLDALEYSQVYINDSQIDELLLVKKRRAVIGFVEVIIKTKEAS